MALAASGPNPCTFPSPGSLDWRTRVGGMYACWAKVMNPAGQSGCLEIFSSSGDTWDSVLKASDCCRFLPVAGLQLARGRSGGRGDSAQKIPGRKGAFLPLC